MVISVFGVSRIRRDTYGRDEKLWLVTAHAYTKDGVSLRLFSENAAMTSDQARALAKALTSAAKQADEIETDS